VSILGKLLAGAFGLMGVPLTGLLVHQGYATWWVAAVLLVLYEGVIALGATVASVAQQRARRRIEQVFDFLDRAFGRSVSRYARYYRRYVLERDSHINARDLAHMPSHIPELDAVYVDVGLAPGSPANQSGGLIPAVQTDQLQRHSIHEFLDKEEPAVCAVIGAPGSGKSTLLRHNARRAASQGRKQRRRRIPIILALRDHADVLISDPAATLADRFREDVGRLSVAEPDGWWETQLRKGNCLVLLDGLDEVARNEDRAAIAEWIDEQIAKNPGNDFVVTSRPHGYRTAVVSRAMVLQVRPFTTAQIRRFIHAWCKAAEHLATRAAGVEIEQRAREEAEDLIAQLSTSPTLVELAVNPLLLTMMVTVHRERRSLPAGRSDLYNQVCDVMLWRRQESKKLEVKPSGTVRQRILAVLAYEMMISTTRDFPRSQVLEVFERSLRQIDTDIMGDELLTALVESSGLLVEREKDVYAFAHHTIGEYLAATHIRSNNLIATLIQGVDDPWWRETTLLFASDSDASDIIEACLDKDTPTSLSLAFDCMRNNGQLKPHLRVRLDQLRMKAFEDGTDDIYRRRVASALAAGQLSNFATTENGSLICPNPILEDLYWLFCKLTGVEFPASMGEVRLTSATPATGMWPADAEAFVRWLNETAVQENSSTYRLPSVAEVKSTSISKTAERGGNWRFAFWTLPNRHEDEPLLWTPNGNDPFMVTVEDIWRAVKSDLSTSTLLLECMLTGLLLDSRTLVMAFEKSLDKKLYSNLPKTYERSIAAATDLASEIVGNIHLASMFGLSSEKESSLARIATSVRPGNNDRNLRSARELEIEFLTMLDGICTLPVDKSLLDSREFLPHILEFEDRKRAREEVIGVALNRAISKTSDKPQKPAGQQVSPDPEEVFVTSFIEAAGMHKSYTASVNIGGVLKSLESACSILHRAITQQRTTSLWMDSVASRFSGEAIPLLTRAREISSKHASDIRIQALILAAEAEVCGIMGAAEEFRRLAAGVTLLEMRAVGKAPTEVIILARE